MIYTTAGSRLYIAEANRWPLRWAEIGGVESLGSLGIEYETAEVLEDSDVGLRLVTVRGIRKPTEMVIAMAVMPDDEGQRQLVAATANEEGCNAMFRLDFANGGPKRFWRAVIVALGEAYDDANAVPRIVARLAVNAGPYPEEGHL